MPNVELIIKISKKVYNAVAHEEFDANLVIDEMRKSIANGTPLPKRMLSVDLIIETLCPKDADYDYPCIAPSYLEEELERLLLDDAPTIIGADKGDTE